MERLPEREICFFDRCLIGSKAPEIFVPLLGLDLFSVDLENVSCLLVPQQKLPVCTQHNHWLIKIFQNAGESFDCNLFFAP
jgi:hypothetical protein